MSQQNSNNDFFSYEGTISRKNYIINMFILIAIFLGLSFIKFETFHQFIPFQFLYTALIFMANMTKFVSLMAMLSVIYRRINDFSYKKSSNFKLIMKRTFVILFVFPVLYDFCIRFFINTFPSIQHIIDLSIIFIFYPLAIISAIVFCFIKGE